LSLKKALFHPCFWLGLSIPSLVLRDLVDFDLPRGSPNEPGKMPVTSGDQFGTLEILRQHTF